MEIEFSPGQIPAHRAVNNGAKNLTTTSAADLGQPLAGLAELRQKLNELALTRQHKMDALRRVCPDVKYPSEELLEGIACLMATHWDL